MKKPPVELIKSYLRRLPNDDFGMIQSRLRDRYGGDVADALLTIQKTPDIDRWLATSQSANELYDMVDLISQYVDCEMRK